MKSTMLTLGLFAAVALGIGLLPVRCLGSTRGDLPTVSVRVVIDSRTLVNGLDHLRGKVELDVAKHLVDLFDDHFGFVDWEAFATGGVGDAACLTLRITDDPTSHALPAIHAQYYVGSSNDTWHAIDGVNSLLRHLAAPISNLHPSLAVVYGQNELPPSHDEKRVADRIRLVVRRHLDTPDVREEFHERFLRAIPIAEMIHVHVTARRVVIPLSIKQLKASNQSRFLVVVNSEVQQDLVQEGEIELEKSGAAGVDPMDTRALVQCIVTRLVFPMYNRSDFDPIIDTITKRAKSIQVFVLKYVPDIPPLTSGSLVTGV